MPEFARYAIYYAPPPGPFAMRMAEWLGWDPVEGREVAHPSLGGLPRPVGEMTQSPRRYGFHGTLKAPFRLADGVTPDELAARTDALAARLDAVVLPGLALSRIGGFVALVPEGNTALLDHLAAEVVAGLDACRAPLTQAEIARRSPSRLTARQRELLDRWGYPYVFEEFRFHLTLSGDLPEQEADAIVEALAPYLRPVLPRPFTVAELCLYAEDGEGRFHLLSRHALGTVPRAA